MFDVPDVRKRRELFAQENVEHWKGKALEMKKTIYFQIHIIVFIFGFI